MNHPYTLPMIIAGALFWAQPSFAQATSQSQAPATAAASRQGTQPESRELRLEALTPSNPDGYFKLGEEVLDAASTPADRALAIRLFVLAAILDAQPSDAAKPSTLPHATAGSAVRALAETTTRQADRDWLDNLARLVDPRQAGAPWLIRKDAPAAESMNFQIVQALGFVRAGDGVRAKRLLSRPELFSRLESYEPVMRRLGVSSSASSLLREADRWPCRDCGGARVVKRAGTPGQSRICTNCRGTPGPDISPEQLFAQLRFELWLLKGSERSWGAQEAADRGAPLSEPTVAELPRRFDIDPALVLYRQGKWVIDPSRPVPKPPTPPTDPNQPAPAEDPNAAPGTEGTDGQSTRGG